MLGSWALPLPLPSALAVAPCPASSPAATWPVLLGLPHSRAVGSCCPPSTGPGGATQLRPAAALAPLAALFLAPRSEPPSDHGSCRDEVTPARRPSPHRAWAPPALMRAAMWHRPREGLPSNKEVHPWPEPNPHAPGCCQTSFPQARLALGGSLGAGRACCRGSGPPGSDVSCEGSGPSRLGAPRARE